MTLQYSVGVRNARLDVIETTVGTSPLLEVRTGAPPANCAAADSGTLLASCTLPPDWMAVATAGTKAKNGVWEDTSANGTGTAGHWRMKDSGGSTCHMQGTVTATGGGGDMTVDSVNFTSGQAFVVSGFTITAANA